MKYLEMYQVNVCFSSVQCWMLCLSCWLQMLSYLIRIHWMLNCLLRMQGLEQLIRTQAVVVAGWETGLGDHDWGDSLIVWPGWGGQLESGMDWGRRVMRGGLSCAWRTRGTGSCTRWCWCEQPETKYEFISFSVLFKRAFKPSYTRTDEQTDTVLYI